MELEENKWDQGSGERELAANKGSEYKWEERK